MEQKYNNIVYGTDTQHFTRKAYGELLRCCLDHYENMDWVCPEEDDRYLQNPLLLLEQKNRFPMFLSPVNKYCIYMQKTFSNLEINDKAILCTPNELTESHIIALVNFIEFTSEKYLDFYEDSPNQGSRLADIPRKGYKSNTRNNWFQLEERINRIFISHDIPKKLVFSNKVVQSNYVPRLNVQVKRMLPSIKEEKLRELLVEALDSYANGDKQRGLEKIWDAFERMKTVYIDLDKKNSANKLIGTMSNGKENFKNLFKDEFLALTKIGNNFRIRHHETDKTDITDPRHFDYFFNRCLSLIALAIPYLEE